MIGFRRRRLHLLKPVQAHPGDASIYLRAPASSAF